MKSTVVKYPQLSLPLVTLTTKKEGNQMAGKKVAAKAAAAVKKAPKGTKPVVIFLPTVLHSRVRLGTMALGTTTSAVVRDLLSDWVIKQKKKIQAVVNMEQVEEDETEEEEEVDNEDESEDEDEDEDEDEE